MWPFLTKLFVQQFYKANTGFFLFFFFLFFGAVEGGSLWSYHLSLMHSILRSGITMSLVIACWTMYHIKCTSFVVRIINSEQGQFLHALQTITKRRQWLLYIGLYSALYLPVLLYGLLLSFIGIKEGFLTNAIAVLLYQLSSLVVFTGMIHFRMNHWLEKLHVPVIHLPFRKPFLLALFFYFTTTKKSLLLILKALSLSLLYIVLVWNRGKYDNDAFLLFYLVILLAHGALPFFALQFWEKDFSISRNLPVSLFARAVSFLLPYTLLLLPEAFYLFYTGPDISFDHKLAYIINLLASLFLLTAIQYSEAQSREEYMKAGFTIILVSIFFLHVEAFWFWIGVQGIAALILLWSGYHSYERNEEQ